MNKGKTIFSQIIILGTPYQEIGYGVDGMLACCIYVLCYHQSF